MAKAEHLQRILHRTRRLPWAVAGLALVVLGGTILLTVLYFRSAIRQQIVNRDAVALYEVALMHAKDLAEELGDLGSMTDPGNQSYVLLQTSRLRGVIATRLFDDEGRFLETFPENVLEARLQGQELNRVRSLAPVCHFYSSVPLDDLFYPAQGELPERGHGQPVLEINIPLHAPDRRELVGVGQFLIQGKPIAMEFARLDRNLMLLAGITFLTGGGLLVVFIQAAFRKLQRAQDLLADRTQTLLRANRELALAAKTSAVGSIASHLIHGLKNPLSGLQNLMAGMGEREGGLPDEDRRQMVVATRRMQSLIHEVVTVLREQEGGQQYELSLAELMEIIETRARPLAAEAKVRFALERETEAALNNRDAGLIILILMNLIQNAIQATPPGREVALRVHRSGQDLSWAVADGGAGFPEELRPVMFTPCSSTRDGGSGIGLAISKQLANHLGARLEMRSSTDRGCVFVLILPNSLFLGHSTVASSDQVG